MDKKKTERLGTWLPVFPGFYNTIFEPKCEADEIREPISQLLADFNPPGYLADRVAEAAWDLGQCHDVISFDYGGYTEAVCETAVQWFAGLVEGEIPPLLAVEYERIVSPKEYNFGNDAVNICLVLTSIKEFAQWFAQYIRDEHRAEFDDYIRERYTSYDGFVSWYSNDPGEWLTDLDNAEVSEHSAGSLLQFWALCEDPTGYDAPYDALYHYVCERVHESEFVTEKISPTARQLKYAGRLVKLVRKGERQLAEYLKQGKSREINDRAAKGWEANRAEIEKEIAGWLLGLEEQMGLEALKDER